ncbi:MAG: response regulator [Thermotogota bacterium]|nr:response regulator [Thermotogota bacterium]
MNQNLKILIAEDEYIVLMGLREALENSGYTVIAQATNGQQAVEFALEHKPDLLIIDINMPILDGIEAIRKINQEINIPAIITTGYNEKELIKRANDAGVFYYLVKPVDEIELKPAIEIVMSRFEEYSKLKRQLKEKEDALESRKFVERAKGILMDKNNIKEAEAMKLLQKMSTSRNKKLAEISKDIIAADKLLSLNQGN